MFTNGLVRTEQQYRWQLLCKQPSAQLSSKLLETCGQQCILSPENFKNIHSRLGRRNMYLALEDELEGECALAGEVGVAFGVINAGLQHPRLVEDSEAWRFIVQTSDEVISAVWPELHFCMDTRVEDKFFKTGTLVVSGRERVAEGQGAGGII